MSKTIIFLDFDGVLCDSVKEAYILARYAYSDISVYEEINEEEYSKFKKARYLVTNSWQYFYLIKSIKTQVNFSIEDIEKIFKQEIKSTDKSMSEKFNKKFLNKRKELVENDFTFWNSLETQTEFLNIIKEFFNKNNDFQFAILSTKNKEAIIKKFESCNIELNPNFIFEKKDLINTTKGEFIKKYLENYKEYSQAILIDDSEENIASCNGIENLNAILTNWGYLKHPEKGKSKEKIIEIIKENL